MSDLHEGHDIRYYVDTMVHQSYGARLEYWPNCTVLIIDDRWPARDEDDPERVNACGYCHTCDKYVNYEETSWESDSCEF